jgi:hypothetical protein
LSSATAALRSWSRATHVAPPCSAMSEKKMMKLTTSVGCGARGGTTRVLFE